MMRTKLALALAGAVAVCFAGSLGATGCSSSSSGGSADAGFDPSTYDAAVGVGLTNCVPSTCLNDLCGDAAVVNCPSPGLCGGTLAGPNQPISYCTLYCTKSSDCPAQTVCETKVTGGHCLKSCTSSGDCSGGFACTLDAGAVGNVCWSAYSGADGVYDAGTGDGGTPEGAASGEGGSTDGGAEAGTPEAGTPEAGSAEAGDDGGGDGSAATDAAADAADASGE